MRGPAGRGNRGEEKNTKRTSKKPDAEFIGTLLLLRTGGWGEALNMETCGGEVKKTKTASEVSDHFVTPTGVRKDRLS